MAAGVTGSAVQAQAAEKKGGNEPRGQNETGGRVGGEPREAGGGALCKEKSVNGWVCACWLGPTRSQRAAQGN